MKKNRLYNWLFRCPDGNYIYGQAPNIPIVIAFVAFLLTLVVNEPALKSTFTLVFRVSVLSWAILEIAWGENNFRRILGLSVLIIISAGVLIS